MGVGDRRGGRDWTWLECASRSTQRRSAHDDAERANDASERERVALHQRRTSLTGDGARSLGAHAAERPGDDANA